MDVERGRGAKQSESRVVASSRRQMLHRLQDTAGHHAVRSSAHESEATSQLHSDAESEQQSERAQRQSRTSEGVASLRIRINGAFRPVVLSQPPAVSLSPCFSHF